MQTLSNFKHFYLFYYSLWWRLPQVQPKRQDFNFSLRENCNEFLYFYSFNNMTRKSLKDTIV